MPLHDDISWFFSAHTILLPSPNSRLVRASITHWLRITIYMCDVCECYTYDKLTQTSSMCRKCVCARLWWPPRRMDWAGIVFQLLSDNSSNVLDLMALFVCVCISSQLIYCMCRFISIQFPISNSIWLTMITALRNGLILLLLFFFLIMLLSYWSHD